MLNILKIFKKYVNEFRYRFLLYLIVDFLIAILLLISPQIMRKIIDGLTLANTDLNIIKRLLLIFFLINIINLLFSYINNKQYIILESNLTFNLNSNLINHLQNISLSFTNKYNSIYLTNRVNNDSNQVMSFSLNLFKNVISKTSILIVSAIYMIKLDLKILIVVLSLMFIYTFIYKLMKEKVYDSIYCLREEQSKFFSDLGYQIDDLEYIKSQSILEELSKKLKLSFQKLLVEYLSNNKLNFIYNSLDHIINISATIFLFIYFGDQIVEKRLTIGMFNVLLSYFRMMVESIQYFFNLGSNIQDTMVSFKRIEEIFNVPMEGNGNKNIDIIDEIKLENLIFSYDIPNSQKPIIYNFNKSFKANTIYLIKGSNGSGKTTLINLIIGLYTDEYSGLIKYNNINIKEIDMINIRKSNIGILNQSSELLNIDYIMNNLNSNNIDYTKYLFESFGIKYIFDELYPTKSYNEDKKFSGGEFQKMKLINILLKNPDLLILDEPTSAMDIKSKQFFKHLMQKIKHNKIIIIINHDKYVDILGDETILLN